MESSLILHFYINLTKILQASIYQPSSSYNSLNEIYNSHAALVCCLYGIARNTGGGFLSSLGLSGSYRLIMIADWQLLFLCLDLFVCCVWVRDVLKYTLLWLSIMDIGWNIHSVSLWVWSVTSGVPLPYSVCRILSGNSKPGNRHIVCAHIYISRCCKYSTTAQGNPSFYFLLSY